MNTNRYLLVLIVSVASGLSPCTWGAETKPATARSRPFRLEIGATIKDLPKRAHVQIWIPVPPSNDHQTVKALRSTLPASSKLTREPKYGNQIRYVQQRMKKPGVLSFNTVYQVRRQEVRALERPNDNQQKLTKAEEKLFLEPNKKVPVTGAPITLLAQIKLLQNQPLAMARQLYDRVDEYVRYDKSQPGFGNGDVLWVCNSQFGNCTDFHSLFISFARSQGLPARFEIGFPLPEKRGSGSIGGYHCWALFHVDSRGWIPVDISEADKHPNLKEYYFGNLSENRVTFTTGRDIELVPQQSAPALNYFVYPHVEVNGKLWPREKIDLKFTYQDQ